MYKLKLHNTWSMDNRMCVCVYRPPAEYELLYIRELHAVSQFVSQRTEKIICIVTMDSDLGLLIVPATKQELFIFFYPVTFKAVSVKYHRQILSLEILILWFYCCSRGNHERLRGWLKPNYVCIEGLTKLNTDLPRNYLPVIKQLELYKWIKWIKLGSHIT